MKLLDTHAHVLKEHYKENLDSIIENQLNEIDGFINIGLDIKTSKETIDLSKRWKSLFSAIGVHPLNLKRSINYYDDLESLLIPNRNQIVAIGETGFDFFHVTKESAYEEQKMAFYEQAKLALKYNLPIIVHSRNSWNETIKHISNFDENSKFVIHSWTGNTNYLKQLLNLKPKIFFGISGIATFKNAAEIQESIKIMPKDKIILETDCPWLAPTPLRGKTNYPKNILHILNFLSDLLNVDEEELKNQIIDNQGKIFKFDEVT